MDDLSLVKTEDLRAELRRREAGFPEPLVTPDWSELTKIVTDGVRKHAVGLKVDMFHHAVFQAAVRAVWGQPFWNWWNDQRESDVRPFG